MTVHRLKLYITGHTTRSSRAIANLRRICERGFADQYELDVVDVLEDPQGAEEDAIIATPTLIRELPPPLRRIVGDLSDEQRVLVALEIQPLEAADNE